MRVDRALEVMENKGLDAIVVADGYSMNYISGFTGATGYLYLSRNRKVILTDSRYTTQARGESPNFETVEVSGAVAYGKQLAEYMQADQVKKVGFEDRFLRYNQVLSLQEVCKGKTWVGLEDSLSNLRMIKNEEEIENLRMAEEIGDKAFTRILTIIKAGMTEIEVAAELEYGMKMNGAQGFSFDTIVASGINSSMPHATPSHKKLEEGDFVTMDFGCIYNGYCSDMTRTVVIGKASDKQKEIYEVVLNAQLAGLEAISAGKTGEEVDKVARDIIAGAGYGAYFGHGLGHSVGLEIHEEPRVSPSGKTVLEENMIETIEPGIYIPDFGGVRIEDMVLVTKNGHINFAHSPKELIEI